MSNNSDSDNRQKTDKGRRGGFRGSPESLKNLKRGNQPPERHVEAQAADIAAVAEESSLVDDMRHVRRFPASADRTEGHRDCRKWKKSDLKGFMGRLADLEKAELAAKPVPNRTASRKPDDWNGVGECPRCGAWHSKNAAGPESGPEFMQPEWDQVLAISKHQDVIKRVLPHLAECDAWLAERSLGAAVG